MRVRFLRDHRGDKGEESYTKGQVIHVDQGVADQLIEAGAAKAFPLSDDEVAEQATKYYAGDDQRTAKQIADRVPQIVALQGDTRQATEDQRGDSDPHVVRQADEETAHDAAAEQAKVDEKAAADAAKEKARADKAAADKAKADAAKAAQSGAQ
jgi:glucose-1-phosphatase